MDSYFLVLAILIVAFLYSSAGHGGGSGYLAMMALWSIAPVYMKISALSLNLFVSLIAFILYYKAGYFRWRLLLPFVIASIPMAFIGAKFKLDPHIYKIILGAFLLFAACRIFYKPKESAKKSRPSIIVALIIGAFIGLFSGMIGIGGGIILSPIILLLRWGNAKEAAAVSALFIFLNSLSGLLGVAHTGIQLPHQIWYWLIAGIVGGLGGSYIGSFKLSMSWASYVLSFVLFIAGIKLIWL